MNQALDVPAGGLFCFSRGEYSDYRCGDYFLAMESLSKKDFVAVIDSIKERCASGEIDMDYGLDDALYDNFVPTLIRTGKIIAVDCLEIHTGSYGEFNLS